MKLCIEFTKTRLAASGIAVLNCSVTQDHYHIIVLSKHPWHVPLEINVQKKGYSQALTRRSYLYAHLYNVIHVNHMVSSKWGVDAYTNMGAYSGGTYGNKEIQQVYSCDLNTSIINNLLLPVMHTSKVWILSVEL